MNRVNCNENIRQALDELKEKIEDAQELMIGQALLGVSPEINFPEEMDESVPMIREIKFNVWHDWMLENDLRQEVDKKTELDGVQMVKKICKDAACVDSIYNLARGLREMSELAKAAADEFLAVCDMTPEKTTNMDDVHREWPGEQEVPLDKLESFLIGRGPFEDSAGCLFLLEGMTSDMIGDFRAKGLLVADFEPSWDRVIDLVLSDLQEGKFKTGEY